MIIEEEAKNMRLSHMLGCTSMIVVLLVTPITVVGANVVAITDGNELLTQCKKTISAYEDADSKLSSDLAVAISCDSYIRGFNDAHSMFVNILVVRKHGDKWTETNWKAESLYCLSDDVSPVQMIRVVVQYLEKNPNKLHYRAKILIPAALQEAFPCR
jgi:hypothetical protein